MNSLRPRYFPEGKPLTPREGHKLVLNLLRSGALEQAEKEYRELGLHKISGDEDILALGGRILKSKALEKPVSEMVGLALEAAEKYRIAFEETKGTYTGINTASLYLVGGEDGKAKQLAQDLLIALSKQQPGPGEEAYYHMATVAEAHLVLGDVAEAKRIFADAIQLDPHNYEARASTLVQFAMLLEAQGSSIAWLDAFRPPAALHYAGHIFSLEGGSQALAPAYVHGLERSIGEELDKGIFGFAYGALAAGSDILIAEQLLARGIELHVVLPCPQELFLEASVRSFGIAWEERFHTCIEKAHSVRFVSEGADAIDDLSLAFGSEVAMGHAVLKAQRLATQAVQFLVWDGQIPSVGAGTARDAILWTKAGRKQVVVPYPMERKSTPPVAEEEPKRHRGLKAMIFADVRGFGALPDTLVPVFLEKILHPLSLCLTQQGHHFRHLNTWGDGLFIVLDSVEEAAKASIALQKKFREVDLEKAGLPGFLALRVAGHYGPVYEMIDPFLKTPGVFGTEVSFAARIEPVTVPGSIYVSETFACALAANTSDLYRCEFVGEITPRKHQKPMPLFSLRKR